MRDSRRHYHFAKRRPASAVTMPGKRHWPLLLACLSCSIHVHHTHVSEAPLRNPHPLHQPHLLDSSVQEQNHSHHERAHKRATKVTYRRSKRSDHASDTASIFNPSGLEGAETIVLPRLFKCTWFRAITQVVTLRTNFISNVVFKSDHHSTETYTHCGVSLEAPQGMGISMLVTDHTCSPQVIVRVNTRQGRRLWYGCQRAISPGPDFVTSLNQVYVDFTLMSAGLYRVQLNVMAFETSALDVQGIHTRYVRPTLGYVQTSGIQLHRHQMERNLVLQTYRDNMDSWTLLPVPLGHVIMVSVAIASLGRLPPEQVCDDRLELWRGNQSSKVWTICSAHHSLSPPHVLNERNVHVHFVSGSGRLLESTYKQKYGSGFRLIFSYHNHTAAPYRLPGGGGWNCSDHYWASLQPHLACNLMKECADGRDEEGCSFTLCAEPDPHNTTSGLWTDPYQHNIKTVAIAGTCYSLHGPPAGGLTWHAANVRCSRLGGHLATFKTARLNDLLTDVFRLDLIAKQGQDVLVGIRTQATNNFIYRYIYQWSDSTTVFFVDKLNGVHNDWTTFGYFRALPVGFFYPELGSVRKLNDSCRLYTCRYLCQRKLDSSSPQPAGEDTEPMAVVLPAPSNVSALPFSQVRCPSGHLAHTFLALDISAMCGDRHTISDIQCLPMKPTTPSSDHQSCRALLASLPLPFACRDRVQTVPYTLVCDYRQDCRDGSDERFCVFPLCDPAVHFFCRNKQCVSRMAICNDALDCADGSDESVCESIHRATIATEAMPSAFVIYLNEKYPELKLIQNDTCPGSHFKCPSDGNCLPVFLRCNLLFDCSGLEDEQGCESYTCPGFYKCRASTVCLHPGSVCDGLPHCPQHDDESLCKLTCPANCTCFGHSFTCAGHIAADRFPQLRFMDARESGMKVDAFKENAFLIYLNLAGCGVISLVNVSLPNLNTLDLRDNHLNSISVADLVLLPNLQSLCLARNPLTLPFPAPPVGRMVHSLKSLDLSQVKLSRLDLTVFASFPELHSLNLSESGVYKVEKRLLVLTRLAVLDMWGCSIIELPRSLFRGMENLHTIYSGNYKMCCAAVLPVGFRLENCYAPSDELSSCSSLLHSNIYRVSLFGLSTFALVGNVVSICVRLILKKSSSKSSFDVFVLHLCVSDFLMGVYLVFIGVADHLYQGRYLWEDTAWRHSVACSLAGFMSMLSCEVSAFLICLITVDRILALRFPFSQMRFGSTSAMCASATAWVIGGALAMIPLLPVAAHWQFYSQTGICIPLPITRNDFPGHGYSFGVIIVLNFVLFMMVAVGQVFIYTTIQSNTMQNTDSTRTAQDVTIASRLIIIVLSDFCCWFPVGLLGLLAYNGIPVSGKINVIMAIFVLPLNSTLNPFLYTMNMLRGRLAKRREEQLFEKMLAQLHPRQ